VPVAAVELLLRNEVIVHLRRRQRHFPEHGVIARVAQTVGHQTDAFGQRLLVKRPVIVRPDGGLEHPGRKRGTARRAHRRRGERLFEQCAFLRHLVHVRCLDERFAVTAELRTHVFTEHPDNIRLLWGGAGTGNLGGSRGRGCYRSNQVFSAGKVCHGFASHNDIAAGRGNCDRVCGK
jgi:hypothetical protein